MSVTVVDNPTDSRFEARVDGTLAGVSEYELTSDTIIFLHTQVAEKYEGQGAGSEWHDMRSMTRGRGASMFVRSARSSAAG